MAAAAATSRTFRKKRNSFVRKVAKRAQASSSTSSDPSVQSVPTGASLPLGSDRSSEVKESKASDLSYASNSPVDLQNKPETEDDILHEHLPEKGFRRKWAMMRHKAGIIVNNFYFQVFIIFLIVVNSIIMGIATFDFVTEFPETQLLFEKVDKGFLVLFTIELVIQFIHNGARIFLDGWLFFDLVVVMSSWISDFLDGGNLQVMRAFRIFRALRLITRVKIMKDLVSALIDTLPNMSAIIFLLFIISYIFAVMFTSLYKDLIDRDAFDKETAFYFSTLGETLFTLFHLMTLDGWADICREIMSIHPLSWIPFVAYVVMTSFVALNLVIAVICDAVNSQHMKEESIDESSYRSSAVTNEESDCQKFAQNIQLELQSMKKEQEEIQSMLLSLSKDLLQSPKQTQIESSKESFELELTQEENMKMEQNMSKEDGVFRRSFKCIK